MQTNINWNDASARARLIEENGIEAYTKAMRDHLDARLAVYPVTTRFGVLFAVKGTDMAFATRQQAEDFSKRGTLNVRT
jgi:hypothetical protein